MSRTGLEHFRRSLSATRREADEIIAAAEVRARDMHDRAIEVERSLAESQIARLVEIRSELRHDQRRIDAGFARLAESMATVSVRLAQAARETDFSVPPRAGGIARTVEFKLSETREVSVRITDLGRSSGNPHGLEWERSE